MIGDPNRVHRTIRLRGKDGDRKRSARASEPSDSKNRVLARTPTEVINHSHLQRVPKGSERARERTTKRQQCLTTQATSLVLRLGFKDRLILHALEEATKYLRRRSALALHLYGYPSAVVGKEDIDGISRILWPLPLGPVRGMREG